MENNIIFLLSLWALRVALVSFVFISWKNLKWGVYLICAFLPTYLIRFKGPFDIPMTALEVMILILFGIWMIKNLRFKITQIRAIARICDTNKILIIGIFLSILSATISMFLSPDFRSATGVWKAYFIEPLLFLAVFLSVIKKDDIKNVIKALGFSALYISLYTIAQKFFSAPIPAPWQEEMRATSIFDFPNAVGLFLAPIIPLLLSQISLSFPRRRESIFLILTAILSVVAIVFAKSEGAITALIAVLFIWLFIKLKRRGIILLSAFGLAAIISILFINTASFLQIKEKLLLNDWSGTVRKTIWSETIEMLKDNPIFGAGLSGYQTAIIPYHNAKWMEIFLYPHNIILNFWSETGLLGLFSFILIIIGFFTQFKIQNSKFKICLFLAMLVLLIHGLVDVPYFKNDLSIVFWLLICLASVKGHP